MSHRQQIVDFVRNNVDAEFDPERDVLTQVLDSVSLLQLVVFLDQELGIALDLSSLTLDVFASVDSLVRTLQEHEAGAVA